MDTVAELDHDPDRDPDLRTATVREDEDHHQDRAVGLEIGRPDEDTKTNVKEADQEKTTDRVVQIHAVPPITDHDVHSHGVLLVKETNVHGPLPPLMLLLGEQLGAQIIGGRGVPSIDGLEVQITEDLGVHMIDDPGVLTVAELGVQSTDERTDEPLPVRSVSNLRFVSQRNL